MAGLSKVEALQLEVDARRQGVAAAHVLGALCALLEGLPHCNPASAVPRLRLRVHVALARSLPELEASVLQSLLAGMGLLSRVASVEVGGVCGAGRWGR